MQCVHSCGAVRCGAVRCGAVRCGAVRCGVVWCGVVRCDAVRCGAVRCGAGRTVRCGAVRACSAMRVNLPSNSRAHRHRHSTHGVRPCIHLAGECDTLELSMEETTDKWSVLPKAERLKSPPVWIVKPAAGIVQRHDSIFMVESYEALLQKMKTRW
jgi:hypothetical protein